MLAEFLSIELLKSNWLINQQFIEFVGSMTQMTVPYIISSRSLKPCPINFVLFSNKIDLRVH
jgi:hypothetical protein